MKRNNVFVWAYIACVLGSVILRLFTAYPMWGTLVFAITVSSVLFSVGELLDSCAKALQTSHKMNESFIFQARQKTKADSDALKGYIDKLERYESADPVLQRGLVDIYQKCDDRMNTIDVIEKFTIQKVRKRKILDTSATACSFLGFFVLFGLLLTATLFTLPVLVQEIITVLSFLVILLTQQLNIRAQLKAEVQEAEWKKVQESHDEVQESVRELGCALEQLFDDNGDKDLA